MIPFDNYSFQMPKFVLKSKDGEVDAWSEYYLTNKASICISPLFKGRRFSVHKSGKDLKLNIEGSDKNFYSIFKTAFENFKNSTDDFIVEGQMTNMSSEPFEVDDIILKNVDEYNFRLSDCLFFNQDITNEVLAKRAKVLIQKFEPFTDSLTTSIMPFSTAFSKDTLEHLISKTMNMRGVAGVEMKLSHSTYTEGLKNSMWCKIDKSIEEKSIKKNKKSKEINKSDFQKGVVGLFEASQNNEDFELVLTPIRPIAKSPSILIATVDKDSSFDEQFKVGDVLKFKSIDEITLNKHKRAPTGSFKVLKSKDNYFEIELKCHVDKNLSGEYRLSESKNDTETVFVIQKIKDPIQENTTEKSTTKPNGEKKTFGKLNWQDKNIRKSKTTTIFKQDDGEDERFVLGEVLVPEEVDAHGDIYDEKEVRLAAHYFMEFFRNVGLMHQELINTDAVVVESFIAPIDMELEASDGTIRSIKKGSWLVGMSIKDDLLWSQIKAGFITGFSIGGVATVEELKKLLKSIREGRDNG